MDEVANSFTQVNNSSDTAESINHLFDTDKELKKIYQITDLSQNEISLITRILMIAELKNITQFKTLILHYCQLKLSKNRQSRREVLSAIEGVNHQRSLLSRANPMNWGK